MLALGIAFIIGAFTAAVDESAGLGLVMGLISAVMLTLFIGVAAPEHYTYRPIDGKIETKMVNGKQVHSFKSKGEEFQYNVDSIGVETGPANALRFTQIEDISNWLSFFPTKADNTEPTLILQP